SLPVFCPLKLLCGRAAELLRYPLVGGVDKCPAGESASGVDNDGSGAESHKSGARFVRWRDSLCDNRPSKMSIIAILCLTAF
ncbi:MAG TPA: hypothetical protein PLR93_08520, partial [Anaerolineales bacterium]|nr:hypothetical protein [Anaerolineales bacterium]